MTHLKHFATGYGIYSEKRAKRPAPEVWSSRKRRTLRALETFLHAEDESEADDLAAKLA